MQGKSLIEKIIDAYLDPGTCFNPPGPESVRFIHWNMFNGTPTEAYLQNKQDMYDGRDPNEVICEGCDTVMCPDIRYARGRTDLWVVPEATADGNPGYCDWMLLCSLCAEEQESLLDVLFCNRVYDRQQQQQQAADADETG